MRNLVIGVVSVFVASAAAADPGALSSAFDQAATAISAVRNWPLSQAPVRRTDYPVNPGGIPYPCANMPVVAIDAEGVITKNGQKLGDSASDYQAACDGVVAWRDTSGELFKDTQDLGQGGSYQIAYYSGVVVWTSDTGELYRDAQDLGAAQGHVMALYSGDVAWRDSFGGIHRDQQNLGSSVQTYQIASRTGDVGWQDTFGALYKNAQQVADNPLSWSMRDDGRLIWQGQSGQTHSD